MQQHYHCQAILIHLIFFYHYRKLPFLFKEIIEKKSQFRICFKILKTPSLLYLTKLQIYISVNFLLKCIAKSFFNTHQKSLFFPPHICRDISMSCHIIQFCSQIHPIPTSFPHVCIIRNQNHIFHNQKSPLKYDFSPVIISPSLLKRKVPHADIFYIATHKKVNYTT